MSIVSVDNISPIGSGTSVTVNSAATLVLNNANSTGVITATHFYGDGSNLTGITGTTINNNGSNRIITGSSTANTLEGESTFTYNGTHIAKIDTNQTYAMLQLDGNAGGAIEFYENGTRRFEIYGIDAEVALYDRDKGAYHTRFKSGGNVELSDGKLLIGTTTAGESSADDLTIANSGHAGMTIRSGTSSWGSFFFSDGTSGGAQYDGAIEYKHNDNYMRFRTAQTEKLRITSSGTLLLGTSTETNNIRLGNKFGIAGTTAYTGMSISNYVGTNQAHGPLIDFNRSRGTSDGSMTTVAANDKLGELIFRGSNGSAFTDAVTLRGYAGTVSGSNVNGVYEISTSNAGSMTVRLRVDENGYVTTPANPKFWAKSNAAQTLTSDGTNYIKNYQNEVFDVGNCYDGTNAFTAPITGYYHFGWSFMLQGSNADTFTYLFGAPLISGNDIQQEVMVSRSGGALYQSVVGSHLLYLTSGQYVQIRMRQSGGSNVSVRSDQAYFWGYLVS